MKKRLIIFSIAVLALTACSGSSTESPANGLVISDPGKTIEVAAGNEFKIVIESNPSTGYHWELVGELDGGILQFVSKDYRANEPVMPGSGGVDVWTFHAVAAGETTITLGYYPPGQGEPAAQEVAFAVVVK
jgi:inhibitor of cysteine peptidase